MPIPNQTILVKKNADPIDGHDRPSREHQRSIKHGSITLKNRRRSSISTVQREKARSRPSVTHSDLAPAAEVHDLAEGLVRLRTPPLVGGSLASVVEEPGEPAGERPAVAPTGEEVAGGADEARLLRLAPDDDHARRHPNCAQITHILF
ncbi:hypothetical protein QJS10_CPB11g01016 [Acorus calamus]|uniref:Uncharacterized protein n=1 Tax=Acorus calamus TaxID=4465 RepID=A0AAV9DT22_ACOCL|nr:hypothetical protein QJS10_CPB11g01016 [Acorus calamus]